MTATHMGTRKQQPFGELIREKRLAKGYSLRKFASLIGISPTYLSHVEQGKVDTPPTVERVRKIAELLEENTDELIAAAGRMPEDLPPIIRRAPAKLPELLRLAGEMSPEQLELLLKRLRRKAERENEDH